MSADTLKRIPTYDVTRKVEIARFRRLWLRPLVFFQLYLSLTVILFFIGPWPWPIDNGGLLLAYLVAAQISILMGYLLAWRTVKKRHRESTSVGINVNVEKGIFFLKCSLVLTLVLFIPTSLSRTGQFLPDISSALNDLGSAYNDTWALLDKGNPYVLEINPLPNLSPDDVFVLFGKVVGMSYNQIINKILEQGLMRTGLMPMEAISK